ncbi:NAD-dependent epimerase/dehydratase family protein [Pseudomonas ovata]|uniref:NAD-dependent epimerase/dehydratase family protein n=1 Tax=Pseudomonas ovata TaxID=1839709 RepID=UPI000D69E228|nr:NAD-dependent epimerase/dehydratase family protein [Pseudomonas ovata]
MKILVTGASGFIGGRFAQHALEQGLSVRINARREEALQHLILQGAEFVPGDLGDAEQVRVMCREVDAVVHCAGSVSTWGRRQELVQANVQLTENVVEACLKQKVRRLVHLSSPSIYFDGRSHLGLKEDQVLKHPGNAYAASKRLAEQKVFGAQEFGLQVIALRPRLVTGAGDHRFFPRLLRLQRSKRLAIVGNGLNKVDFTSMANLNQALLSSLLAGSAALGKAYNISNGQPVPLWDAINYVMRRLQLAQVTRYRGYGPTCMLAALNEGACLLWPGRPEPALSRLDTRIMHKDFTLDISRARHYLGYEPQVSLWAALDEFCAWWQAGPGIDRHAAR